MSAPLFRTTLKLAATPTATSVARLFTRATCKAWLLDHLLDDAQLVVSELVTIAVKMTGVLDPHPSYEVLEKLNLCGVQLRTLESSVFVDVWDANNGKPFTEPNNEAERLALSEELEQSALGMQIISEVGSVSQLSLAGHGHVTTVELDAGRGAAIAGIRQKKPSPLPWNWRQIMNSSARQTPQEAKMDAAFFKVLTDAYDHRCLVGAG